MENYYLKKVILRIMEKSITIKGSITPKEFPSPSDHVVHARPTSSPACRGSMSLAGGPLGTL